VRRLPLSRYGAKSPRCGLLLSSAGKRNIKELDAWLQRSFFSSLVRLAPAGKAWAAMISSGKKASRAAKWLAMQLCRFVGARRIADLLYARRLEGFLSTPKVSLLYRTVTGLSGAGQIAEIGSWKGKSTVVLSLAAKRAGRGETVYAIDHHLGIAEDARRDTRTPRGSTWPAFLRVISDAGVYDVVQPLRMTSLDGARWLTQRQIKLKFLLVDGAHDEESVTKDLHAFFPLVLPGGLIALDDAKPDGYFSGVYAAYRRVIEKETRRIASVGTLLLVQKLSADV
jgi:predicted O-methyltransferase YrrM